MRARTIIAALLGAAAITAGAPAAALAGWSSAGQMSVTRAQSHTLTTLQDGRVLAVGGLIGVNGTTATDITELYDPASNSWQRTGNLIRARSRHIAALLPDGRVLVAGGLVNLPDGRSVVGRDAEIYDPASGTWAPTAPMSEPRLLFSASTLPDGRILVTGGQSGELPAILKSAEIYDPSTATWTSVARMAVTRYIHGTTTLADGRVVAAGGAMASHCTARDTAEVYDPVADTWTMTGGLPEAHQSHSQALLPDGRVLVAGGWSLPQRGCTSDGRLRNSTTASIALDPLTLAWIPTGPLNVARAASATVRLGDGRVLAAAGIVGGEDSNTRTASAEIFDATLGGWALTDSLAVARSGPRGALLAGGRVLVAGGNANSGPQASAELFTP